MDQRILDVSLKTTRTVRRERLDFARDRLGHNGRGSPGRITYLAHAKGYVMARRPGCVPFVISDAMWRSFPYWDRTADEQIRKTQEG